MNKPHPNIKFTFEVEQNNIFSFLEINICHGNHSFTTSAYRKPTFSGVLTNFASFMYLFPINLVYLIRSYFATSLYAVVMKKIMKILFI